MLLSRRCSIETHVGAAAGLADLVGVATDDDVGVHGVAGAVGNVSLLADPLAVLIGDLGAGDSGRENSPEDSGLHFYL